MSKFFLFLNKYFHRGIRIKEVNSLELVISIATIRGADQELLVEVVRA